MNQETVNRAGEKVLGIIGIVFNILAMALIGFAMASYSRTPEFRQSIEDAIRADPTMANPEDVEMIMNMMSSGFGVMGWVMIAVLALSTLLAIIAIVNLRKKGNASTAGVLFILAGLFAGLLSLTSILFYIAAIMCFVRKPRVQHTQSLRDDDFKYQEDEFHRKEDSFNNDSTTHKDDDTPYRPL
ncbi:MAG: DUF4064 domain-containing protein [Planococcus sp. (in: firmicutes)]|uniref:DUF4064 domain-containing protein n=1 Tax=Planococcus halocryophilus TaxID=1215089 RepID=UPI001F0F0006|nr:DUF4064 domain-containing protein [Planococcus halocryophilus]MCH4826577.1 DUF4064 domain-containing protein [Planococcus halocryophilus]